MKTCISCKHWYFDSGSPAYSEYTPGDAASLGCYQNHWGDNPLNNLSCDTNEFRKLMNKAIKCKDYKHYEEK